MADKPPFKLDSEIRVRIPDHFKQAFRQFNMSAIIRPILLQPELMQTLADQDINIPETLTALYAEFFTTISHYFQKHQRLPRHITLHFDLVTL